jgi:hypothetical protein
MAPANSFSWFRAASCAAAKSRPHRSCRQKELLVKFAVRMKRAALCVGLVLPMGACELIGLGEDREGARLLRHSPGLPAWAPAGRVIYYTDRAGSRQTSFTINAIDANSGRTEMLPWLEFSPDARQLGLVLSGRLYVVGVD